MSKMKFVTDLSKGILGTADSTELWEEIVAHIPDSVLLKPDLKILNVAFGHCTEADVLVRRMQALGLSNERIQDSIYLLDKYRVFTNRAKRRGYENVLTVDFLEWETDMKFDVVLGNPPYQSGNGEKGGARSLWRKFIKASFEVVKPNGYVSLVCPGFPHDASDLGKYFTNNTPLILNNDVTEYFVGVGSEIKYWIVQDGVHNKDFVVDGHIWNWSRNSDPTVNPIIASIFQKTVHSNNLFECKQDRGYSSTQLKNDNNDYFAEPTGDSIYPIRHASTVKTCYVKSPTECHDKRKVMMTFSGYPDFQYFDENTPMSSCYQMSGYIIVNNETDARQLINLYSTKLYRFLSQGTRSAGMKSVMNYSLPSVDLTRTWTDAELYAHFGLTQEEIDYVEANIK